MDIQILTNTLSEKVVRLGELSKASSLTQVEREEQTRLNREIHELNAAIRKATDGGGRQTHQGGGHRQSPSRQGFTYQSVFQDAEVLEGGSGRLQVLEAGQPFAEQGDAPEFSIGQMIQNFLGVQTNHQSEIREAINSGSDAAGGLFIQPTVSDRLIDLARARMTFIRAGGRTVAMNAPRMVVGVQNTDPTPHWRTEGSAIDPSAPTFSKIEVV